MTEAVCNTAAPPRRRYSAGVAKHGRLCGCSPRAGLEDVHWRVFFSMHAPLPRHGTYYSKINPHTPGKLRIEAIPGARCVLFLRASTTTATPALLASQGAGKRSQEDFAGLHALLSSCQATQSTAPPGWRCRRARRRLARAWTSRMALRHLHCPHAHTARSHASPRIHSPNSYVEEAVAAAKGRETVRLVQDGSTDSVDGEAAVLLALARINPAAGLEGTTAVEAGQVASWVYFAHSELRTDAVRAFVASLAAIRQLGRMGVRSGHKHDEAMARLMADAEVVKPLAALDGHLVSHTFLVGEQATVADYAVAAQLGDFAFVLSRDDCAWPSLSRWFRTVARLDEFAAAASMDMLYTSRIGGQVDQRAVPAHVAAAAEVSMSKNVGAKKGPSQRDIEKAAKKKKPAPAAPSAAGGAGSSEPESKGPALPGATATEKQPESNAAEAAMAADEKIAKTLAMLDKLDISYVRHDHPVAMTVEAMMEHAAGWEGVKAKNLFLKAKKPQYPGDTQLWLVVADVRAADRCEALASTVVLTLSRFSPQVETAADMKTIASKLGYGKVTVRFGNDAALAENLGVAKGSVSPFCLANDTALRVNVAIDKRIVDAEKANFHPGSNTATVTVTTKDLLRFIESTGHRVNVIDFAA